MKSLAAISYLLALAFIGFALWILRSFLRSLRKRHQLPDGPAAALRGPVTAEESSAERIPVDWPVNLFLGNDDIDYPGHLEALTPGGAFLRCSAPLRIGQEVSLYIALPGEEQCRATAQVLWVGLGKGRLPAAQVRFAGLPVQERERLLAVAGAAPDNR